jgi:hypothetical protein
MADNETSANVVPLNPVTRVLGIAAVLFMAGLLLAFGTALRQPTRK